VLRGGSGGHEDLKEKKLAERANEVGKKVMAKFRAFPEEISFCRRRARPGGDELHGDRGGQKNPKPNADLTKSIVRRCYEKGLIILTAGGYGNVIRHLVPLVITDDQLEKGLRILEEVMAEKAE